MMKFDSIEEWRDYCFSTHKSYVKNEYFRCWLNKKKVNIFNYTKLNERDVKQIIKTIGSTLKLCNPNFKIKLFKRKFSELYFAVQNNNVDGAKVLEMVKKSRIKNKKCSANIFLVDRKIKSGKAVLKFGDALTYVSDGVIIFTFDPLIDYPKRFFKSAIAHEVCHLLGFNVHHYDAKVEGYGRLARCLMEYNAPSDRLCSKCKYGMLSFLEGIKYAIRQ